MNVVIDTHFIVYVEDGKQYPAYCLNANLPGAEDGEYGVTVEDMSKIAELEDVWRVLLNGYPYKTPEQMGLQSKEEAYVVTKQAVYCVLDGRDTSRYSGVTARGQVMADKIREIVNIGRNGTQTYKDPVISTSAVTTAGIDNKDKTFVSQTFTVNSDINIKDIKIVLNTQSAPTGTKVTDVNNNIKTTFNKGENFKILVPRENIKGNINVEFSVSGQCETYPILFGSAPNNNIQDYVLTTDPFVLATTKGNMYYDAPTFDLTIEKVSSAASSITGLPAGSKLPNATFTVESEDGKVNETIKTGANGTVTLKDLPVNVKLTVTEVTSPDYYLKVKDHTFEVEAEYDGDDKKLTVTNVPVEIKVDINKNVDKSEAQVGEKVTYDIDNIKNLSNVSLSNYTVTDNLPKEVRIQKLETGTYNEDLKYSIEYNTNKKSNVKLQQNLSTKTNNTIDFTKITLAEGEYITSYSLKFGTVKIGFANTSKMKVETKVASGVVEKTSFVNNVKVTGTYLEAKAEDKDDAVVKTYANIVKISKVSKEYNQYLNKEAGSPIDGTVFEILDANKKFVATVKTANGGKAEYKYLETGKQYYLHEISTAPYYTVNQELVPFKFEKNGQVVELKVQNDNANLLVNVEKEAPTEAQKGEIIDYTFNNIGNFSNVKVSNFIWGDKLPRQVRVQELQTGIWNQDLSYEIQFITNKNTNWKKIGTTYKTTKNNTINLTSQALKLDEDEYVTEFRLVFGEVKAGFKATTTPIVKAKVNEDVQNNKIFVNKTYVTADYQTTKLEVKDDAHTIVYTKTADIDKELPKTGMDN